MRAGFDLGVETLDFVIEIVGYRINSHTDGEICCATESFARPVRALIEAMQNFDQADGINFVDTAGFRVVANRWRIACDAEHVANAADRPSAEQHGLQADDVEIARGQVWDSFNAARFERAGNHQRIHAYAGHGAAVDVYGVGLSRGHNFVHLLVNAVERNTFRGIDLHADGKFFSLQFFPEFAFWRAFLNGRGLGRDLNDLRGSCVLGGPQRFYGFGHGANVRGRGAAAAAEDAHAQGRGFSGKQRKISRRRFRIDDAVAFAFGKARIRHAAHAYVANS